MMGQWAQLVREWARACCKSNKLTKKNCCWLLFIFVSLAFFFLSVLINNADCREDEAGGEEVLMAD